MSKLQKTSERYYALHRAYDYLKQSLQHFKKAGINSDGNVHEDVETVLKLIELFKKLDK